MSSKLTTITAYIQMHFHNDKRHSSLLLCRRRCLAVQSFNRINLDVAVGIAPRKNEACERFYETWSYKKDVSVPVPVSGNLYTCTFHTHQQPTIWLMYLSLSGHIQERARATPILVGSRPDGCSRITYTLFKRKKLRLK